VKNNLPYLINLPPFLLKNIIEENLSTLDKVFLIIKGKFFAIVIKLTKGNLFCLIINSFFKKDGHIQYKDERYVKITKSGSKLYFPNKRILRVVKDYSSHLDLIYNSYLLEHVDLKDKDLVIDCGANVGELYHAIKNKDKSITYIGFEPDNKAYECLKLNIVSSKSLLENKALSMNSSKSKLYLDTLGGNSSLEKFSSSEHIEVQTIRLDDYSIEGKIKLLKIEAEGHEPEVLSGGLKTLSRTQYVSVDFGPERGESEDFTIVEVNKILYDNNFELIKFSQFRYIGLYKNKLI
jgi:FkbM family methyltransferase